MPLEELDAFGISEAEVGAVDRCAELWHACERDWKLLVGAS